MVTDNKFNNLALKTLFKDRKELSGSCLKIAEDAFYYMNLSNHINSTFNGLQITALFS